MRAGIAIVLVAAALAAAAAVSRSAPDVRKEFAAREAKVEATDADGLYRLALWARGSGLLPEARATFLRALRVDPDHRAARKALGYELIGGLWLRGDAAKRAKGFVFRDGRWLLAEELAAGREKARAEEEQAAKALRALASGEAEVRTLAVRTLAELPAERLVRPCILALEQGAEPARLYATKALAGQTSDECVTALIRASIMDVSDGVRTAATAAVAAAANPDTIYPYLRALTSAYAPVRMNAAKAVGTFRDVRGIQTIIRRLRGIQGGTSRVNIQVGRQTSYIRDFDVEIAQAAQIGDPIVGSIQEGVVLDVRVLSIGWDMTTVERRVLYETLTRITGQDFGENVKAWTSWWEKNEEQLLETSGRGDGSQTRRRE
jgi:hypothetical protein